MFGKLGLVNWSLRAIGKGKSSLGEQVDEAGEKGQRGGWGENLQKEKQGDMLSAGLAALPWISSVAAASYSEDTCCQH